MSRIQIDHYSDVLCIWAYASQVRVDELIADFGDRVSVRFHFFPVFGDVPGKMAKSWDHRGGLAAYGKHVLSVAEKFEHIRVNENVWLENTPQSSVPAHLFLAAAQLLEEAGQLTAGAMQRYMCALRRAFFVDIRDISRRETLIGVAEAENLPVAALLAAVDDGRAHALISRNHHQAIEQGINSSPTLIFNEGRQKLSGNVGYRIIEANIRELLENPAGQLSWC